MNRWRQLTQFALAVLLAFSSVGDVGALPAGRVPGLTAVQPVSAGGGGSIAIRDTKETGGGSGTTIAVSGLNVVAGDTIIIFVGWEWGGTARTITGVADSRAVDTYSSTTQSQDDNPVCRAQWWYVHATTTNASTTVTATFSGSVDFTSAKAYSLSGAAASGPIEATAIGGNTGTAVSTASLTASTGSWLFAGYYAYGGCTTTWTTPNVEDVDALGTNVSVAHSESVTSGSKSASATKTAGDAWAATMISVKL